jgi:hypothetical protein
MRRDSNLAYCIPWRVRANWWRLEKSEQSGRQEVGGWPKLAEKRRKLTPPEAPNGEDV